MGMSEIAAGATGVTASNNHDPSRPNIVVVLTDDQGPWAVPWRTPELHMPALAQLASQGFRFDQFYCASPVCSPARASLLTGRMPSAHGVHDWLTGTRHPRAHADKYLENLLTLPQVLAGAGYSCAMSGKWHVGDTREPAPGFEQWYAHRYGGSPYYDAPIWNSEGEPDSEPRYFTDAVAEHAVEFLRNRPHDKPFFLWAATTAPHDPWLDGNHPKELVDLYAEELFPSVPREPRHPWTQARVKDFDYAFANPEPALRGYFAALSGVDRMLKSILAELEQQNIADNTVVLFMSDNGFSCGHHGVWGKGNGTYPLNFWDNSVQVPAVLSLPEKIRKHHHIEVSSDVVEHPVSAVDVFPTLVELAAATAPTDPLRAGTSMLEILRDRSADAEAAYTADGEENRDGNFRHPVVVFDEYGGGRMIRTPRWKLVERWAAEEPDELYDMVNDPQERCNLLDNQSAGTATRIEGKDPEGIARALSAQLTQWFAAHETKEFSAFDRPVKGFGQILPAWRSTGKDAFVQGPDE